MGSKRLFLVVVLLLPLGCGSPCRDWDKTEIGASVDALDEVNALRVKRGLAPFQRNDDLTAGAKNVAMYRARHRIIGHTANDFEFIPHGAHADGAGCAAWPPEVGWGSCFTYSRFRIAGAAWVKGEDGLRYMHLFVR